MASAPDSERTFAFGRSLCSVSGSTPSSLVASWCGGLGACLPFFPFPFPFGVVVTPGLMDRELEGFFPSGCFLFQFWGCPVSALAVAGKGGSVLRAHPFFGTVAWCLFRSLLFPSYATRCRYDVPGVLASCSGLAASACGYACGRCLRIALGPGAGFPFFSLSLWEGHLMGQRLVIVSSPLGGCVSFTPFRLGSVASALSLPESWLFFLLWICRFTVGSSGAVPRGNFCCSREGWGLPVLSMVEFCLTFFLSFPGCSHPGLVGASSPGFDFTGLVAWSLLAPRSWKPPCQFTPFARSVVLWRWCGADDSLPLVSSLLAVCFGFWPYGLAITAGLASMDRPLLVSSVESQLWGFCSWLYRASWLAQGCIPLLRLLPYF